MSPFKKGHGSGRVKDSSKKNRLIRAGRRAKSVPTWVIVKTNRHVRNNPRQRHWNRKKLGLK